MILSFELDVVVFCCLIILFSCHLEFLERQKIIVFTTSFSNYFLGEIERFVILVIILFTGVYWIGTHSYQSSLYIWEKNYAVCPSLTSPFVLYKQNQESYASKQFVPSSA